MPKAFPNELREDVIRVFKSRMPQWPRSRRTSVSRRRASSGGLTIDERRSASATSPARAASESERCGSEQADQAARAGERGPAPRGRLPLAGAPAGKMMYPLVPRARRRRDPRHGDVPGAEDRPPALLPLARQPGHRRRTGRGVPGERAVRRPPRRPEFGYRFLVDEARDSGEAMAERTAWKLCSQLGWWSVFGKKRGRNGKTPGPPVHDDLVERDFTAPPRIVCGSVTSPSTGRARASCICARSRRCTPTGSSATASTHG